MLEICILAIVMIPVSILIVAIAFERLLAKMLEHQASTTSVGGQPLALILREMEDRKEAAIAMREEQADMLEQMKTRRREALG